MNLAQVPASSGRLRRLPSYRLPKASLFIYCAERAALPSHFLNYLETINPQINPRPGIPIGKPRFCDIPAVSELVGKSPSHIRNKQSHLGFNNRVRKWCDFKVFISPGMHFPKQELADTGRVSAGKTRSGLGGPEKKPALVPRASH